MKKFTFLIAAIITCSLCKAQTTTTTESRDYSFFSAGIGFGTPYFGYGYTSSVPVNPTLTYEQTVADEITAGGELSYARNKLYDLSVNTVYVGARASYHFGALMNLKSNLDIYGGVGAGYVIVNVSDDEGDSATASSGVGYGLYGGVKYYFAKSVGVYAEAGYQSLSYLNVGLAFKL
jgi:hypothetical protein